MAPSVQKECPMDSKALAYQKEILQQLQNSNIEAAEALLSKWPMNSNAEEQLAQKQLLGKICLYRQHYLRALDFFYSCHINQPQNLEILCDLALCYYQLGLQADLENILQKSIELLQDATHEHSIALSIQERLNTTVFLAKLLEECGLVADALELLKLNKIEVLTFLQRKSLLIQQLRLFVLLKDRPQAESLYHQVLSCTEHTVNFEIEREHVLMLADFFLLGYPAAKTRFEQIIQNPLSLADQSFILTEILELSSLAGQLHNFKNLPFKIQPESEYEKEVIKLIESSQKNENYDLPVTKLEKKLTRLSLLRLFRLSSILHPQKTSQEFLQRYLWHTNQLKHSVLKEQFRPPQQNSTLKILKIQKQIFLNGQKYSFSSDFFWKTLEKTQKGSASLEELANSLYQENLNSQHYDRIRMSAYRTNKDLEKTLGISNFFKITKSGLSIQEKIEVCDE